MPTKTWTQRIFPLPSWGCHCGGQMPTFFTNFAFSECTAAAEGYMEFQDQIWILEQQSHQQFWGACRQVAATIVDIAMMGTCLLPVPSTGWARFLPILASAWSLLGVQTPSSLPRPVTCLRRRGLRWALQSFQVDKKTQAAAIQVKPSFAVISEAMVTMEDFQSLDESRLAMRKFRRALKDDTILVNRLGKTFGQSAISSTLSKICRTRTVGRALYCTLRRGIRLPESSRPRSSRSSRVTKGTWLPESSMQLSKDTKIQKLQEESNAMHLVKFLYTSTCHWDLKIATHCCVIMFLCFIQVQPGTTAVTWTLCQCMWISFCIQPPFTLA